MIMKAQPAHLHIYNAKSSFNR